MPYRSSDESCTLSLQEIVDKELSRQMGETVENAPSDSIFPPR
jgi:hypothetical protein